jgi:hypothetical protein
MKKLLSGMGLALALGACVSTPQPNAALESARAAVQAAEADPYVSKYAALDLDAARKDLAVADDAALHHRGDAAIAQPAYMAAQNARLAQMHAATKADDARVAAGQTERNQIMLNAKRTTPSWRPIWPSISAIKRWERRLAARGRRLAAMTKRFAARGRRLAAMTKRFAARGRRLAAMTKRLAAVTKRLAAKATRLAARKKRLACRLNSLNSRRDPRRVDWC